MQEIVKERGLETFYSTQKHAGTRERKESKLRKKKSTKLDCKIFLPSPNQNFFKFKMRDPPPPPPPIELDL